MKTPARSQRLLDTFDARLKDWTLQAACQFECKAQGHSCICDRDYVHVARFEEWLQRKETDDTRNIDRLLDELHPRMTARRTIPFRADSILGGGFSGENRCVRVFGTLLKLGYGHLIDLFHKAKIYDGFIRVPNLQYLNDLENSLMTNNAFETVDQSAIQKFTSELIANFEKHKWAFCHPTLALHVDDNFDGAKFILPFCRYDPVNGKGGTATVFQAVVQKHFVTDDRLAAALQKSVHRDVIHGECYKLAVKTFSCDATDIYEWEKEAFSAFRHVEDSPIVKYLGSFSHGDGDKKVHKLLLEYGDMDLDEYCADLENVAPVQSGEIIRFWKSLFEVAKAIKDVHHVPIKQGKNTKIYNGWHADIKPDNILLVHGVFKLADFGFARFAMTAEDGKPPEQFITGGTDTYGAPEFASSKRARTKTPVKQTIDTWSFGCVLSIAATWIVLGFQGVEQYRKLRIIANSDRPAGNRQSLDRFHDGSQVLPEITSWHGYIRNHVRKADTITARVLDLVDHSMLKSHADERLTSAKLCIELDNIIVVAEHRVKQMLEEGELVETDVLVQRALLVAEKEARKDFQNSLQAQPAPVQLDGPGAQGTLQVTFGAPGTQSKRFGKEERLQRLPPAKTLHRERILEEELEKKQYHVSLSTETPGPIELNERHSGALTSSPTTNAPKSDATTWSPSVKAQSSEDHSSTIVSPDPPFIIPPTPPAIHRDQVDNKNDDSGKHIAPDPSPDQNSWLKRNDSHKYSTPNIVFDSPETMSQSSQTPKSPVNATNAIARGTSLSSDALRISTALPSSFNELPFDICKARKDLDLKEESRSAFQKFAGKFKTEDQAKDAHLAKFINSRDLVSTYVHVEKASAKSTEVFVIDNGTSMLDYWPILTFVAETLARKVAGLDDDGLDVAFTVKGHLSERKGLSGKKGRAELSKALRESKPSPALNDDEYVPTNMYQTFDELFRAWENSARGLRKPRRTTWIVLTDGIWKGTVPPEMLERRIAQFGKYVQETLKLGARHCSIAFVHFGHEGKQRLVYLDDELCKSHNLHDFIDQSSWRESVHKMLLGSLDPYQDQKSPEPTAAQIEVCGFDDKSLAKLFADYNGRASTASLTSPTLLSRSLSRASSFEPRIPENSHRLHDHLRQAEASGTTKAQASSSKPKTKNRNSGFFGKG